MKIVISSGHSTKCRGASGYIDEVDEAIKVTNKVAELMRGLGAEVTTYTDTVSTSQNENLNRIVDFHNSKTRDWDISVHFNAYQTTSKAMGTEVLFVSNTGLEMAEQVVDAIASVGFINRGPKKRTDLFFLNNTEEPAILIEACFVDSKADVDLYNAKLNEVCSAIAGAVVGGNGDEVIPDDGLTPEEEAIADIAISSDIASYSWRDRGRAPPGYLKGFGLAWAQALKAYEAGDPAVLEMAKANTKDSAKDVLQWYYTQYQSLGMDNSKAGIDTLRHLFALLLGLGMRESSGKHCEGRDQSANNTDSNTCEAGLYQTSYNAHSATPEFENVMVDYEEGARKGYMEVFAEGVTCNSSSWACYGSGRGLTFQKMCKEQPAFAVETCALTLRNLRQHYGPINREEAELRQDSDDMLRQVQDYVLGAAPPGPEEITLEERVFQLEKNYALLDARVTALESIA